MKYFAEINDEILEFETYIQDDERVVEQDGRKINFDLEDLGNGRYSLLRDNQSYFVRLTENNGLYQVNVLGQNIPVHVEDERERRLKELVKSSKSGPSEMVIMAPIPGLVVKVIVKEGDVVQKGDALLILEAMKMENIIKAPGDFKVQKISVTEKEAVHQEQALIQLAAVDE